MFFDKDPLGFYSVDIKYEGSTKATQYCIDDFMKLLYGSRKIVDMTILTYGEYHALMLCFENDDYIVFIKSGLTSGYMGEGPKGTSLIIRLAEEAGITIKELNTTPSLFKRINTSLATSKDVQFIKKNRKDSFNYNRLCLKLVNKEYLQRAKESFSKNKNVIFVRDENEKTKETVELDRARAIKLLEKIDEKMDKICENTNKPGALAVLGDISSIVSTLKGFLGL